jgi:hypothetical protein
LQTLRLSRLPAGIGVHLPRDAASAQLRQAPAQPSLQQTPSTQKFDLQSVAFVHAPPSCFGPQLPPTQAMPVTQSASVLHLVLQAPLTQRKGRQSCTPAGRQAPRPSQVPAVLSRSPAQDGGTQTVSAAYFVHAPNPSQVPVCPQLGALVSLQIARGSGFP